MCLDIELSYYESYYTSIEKTAVRVDTAFSLDIEATKKKTKAVQNRAVKYGFF